MALAATVVHLVATVAHLVASVAVGKQQRLPAGLLASAQLGLPAAAAALGLATGLLRPPIAAALVAGGLLTPDSRHRGRDPAGRRGPGQARQRAASVGSRRWPGR